MHTVVLSSDVAHPHSLELFRLLEADLGATTLTLASFDSLDSYLEPRRPQTFVVSVSPDPEQALRVVDRLRSTAGGFILAVGPTGDAAFVRRTLDAGVARYLDQDELSEQLKTVLPHLRGGNGEVPALAGRVISILAASGGSGASTLAANLAVVLTRQAQRCVLIDLKPCGDLAALLDLKPPHTLADLCRNLSRVDPAIFDKVLAEHPSGVRLLASPQEYESIRVISPEGVRRALAMARANYSCVIVDHEDCFHEEQVLALRETDAILLVARPDYTSLRHTRRILDQLGHLGLPRQRVQLVINRHGQAKELPAEEVQRTLEVDHCHLIPDDPAAVHAASGTGVPLVIKTPSSRTAQAIERLGKTFCPPVPTPTASRNPLRWLMPFRSRGSSPGVSR
jgi:pilus assembly protein CpaE